MAIYELRCSKCGEIVVDISASTGTVIHTVKHWEIKCADCAEKSSAKREKCDHKFVDSQHCLKCGWAGQ